MYIATNKTVSSSRRITAYMPHSLRRYMYGINFDTAYEIHLGVNMPLAVYFPDGRFFVTRRGILTRNASEGVTVTRADIDGALELITDASIYSVKDEICGGFVTVDGGHRVGITGSAVIRNGRISFVKDISALNFRLAAEVTGAADNVIAAVTDGQTVKNTLFISPPGAGKTTILRDTARRLSEAGFRVSIADERYEIAAMHGGKSAFDLGPSCDVLSGAAKSEAMITLLRSMSPDVIITDELGGDDDFKAVEKLLNCGVSVIASVHGRGVSQARSRCGDLIKLFDIAVVMSKNPRVGTIEDVALL